MSRHPLARLVCACRLLPLVALSLFAVVSVTSPAVADLCTGATPWINEVDYDSNDGGFNDDRDEFVEIAGPAGTDISGFKILAVEGNASFLQCTTGIGGSDGNAYFTATLPGGTVLGDDTGTGVGFHVVCFQSTSANVVAAGKCDVVLPGVASDSNLKNGDLFPGGNTFCPDGVLMLDAANNLMDAVSWEGVIPNKGSYGAHFNPPNPAYNAGEDPGFVAQQSLIKTSSSVGRATMSSEWSLSGGAGSASPGVANAGQSLECDPPVVLGEFAAYNDVVYDPGSAAGGTDPQGTSIHYIAPNVTRISIGAVNHGGTQGPSSGVLLDQATGLPTGVTATLTQSGGVVWQPWVMPNADPVGFHGGYDTAPGTDAHSTFAGIADMTGVVYYGAVGWYVDLTLSGLDPAETYTFATSASRAKQNTDGAPGYADRVTIFSLAGASSSTPASTPGATVVSPTSVKFSTGNNHAAGYVARWTDIDPGPDGTITIRAEADPGSPDGKAYAFDVFMLALPADTSATCGDGNLDPGEACDDGNTTPGDGCSDACVVEFCGDTIVQPGIGEQCDDGNGVAGDGCTPACVIEFCGDGVTQPGIGEECDDGNGINGDGCNSICVAEFCGDGITQPGLGEACDDANASDADDCTNACAAASCGDGLVWSQGTGTEDCDGDGLGTGGETALCDLDCSAASCGDGSLNATSGEACDDGNTLYEDGCSGVCAVESCGDQVVQVGLGEECDDGNGVDDDGCSNACLFGPTVAAPGLSGWGVLALMLTLISAAALYGLPREAHRS